MLMSRSRFAPVAASTSGVVPVSAFTKGTGRCPGPAAASRRPATAGGRQGSGRAARGASRRREASGWHWRRRGAPAVHSGDPGAVRLAGDATPHELAVAAPLVVAVVALGVLPWLLLDVTGPAVRLLLGGGAP